MLPALYLLTPEGGPEGRLVDGVVQILHGAAPGWLQYRDKSDRPAIARRAIAEALRVRCHAAGWRFLVNDDVRLALDCGADGVHLGEHDGDLAQARAALGAKALIGASCYDDLARARRAHAAGASYLAFGAFFASTSKPLARRATPALLTDARSLGLPLCAIGGITQAQAAGLIQAGADLIAVIQSVWAADDPPAAARALQAAIASGAAARTR